MATMTTTQPSIQAFTWLRLDKYRGAVVEVRTDVMSGSVLILDRIGPTITACFCTP
jgi:hypothetical protein